MIQLHILNKYAFPLKAGIIDEVPHQFQVRNALFKLELQKGEEKQLKYFFTPG
jgi:hypothetical protein